MILSWVASWRENSATTLPGAHDEDAVTYPQYFGQVRRNHHHSHPVFRQVVHQGVDFSLGSDIDASAWVRPGSGCAV